MVEADGVPEDGHHEAEDPEQVVPGCLHRRPPEERTTVSLSLGLGLSRSLSLSRSRSLGISLSLCPSLIVLLNCLVLEVSVFRVL